MLDNTAEGFKSVLNRLWRLSPQGLAIVMAAIYLVFVIAFPLIPNVHPYERAADLEILMRPMRPFALVYVAGILGLFLAFWAAMRRFHAAAQGDPGAAAELKRFVLGSGLIFCAILIFLYPISAIDVFLYVVRGRVWAVHGESPFVTAPNAFPNDPYLSLMGEFSDRPSSYGPLWELVVQVPLRLGSTEALAGVVSIKLLMVLAYLATAVLLGWLAFPDEEGGGAASLTAMAFYAWNPLILIQGIGNGHNDMLMVALIVLGMALWRRKKWLLTALALTLALLVKIPGLLLMPLFGVALLRSETTWRGRAIKALSVIVLSLGVTLLVYRAFGPLSEVFAGVQIALFSRRGYSPIYVVWTILREMLTWDQAWSITSTAANALFVLYYGYLALRVWSGKLDLVTAGFWAFFSQLMLGATFRIWYPLWLVPLAALALTSRTFWRSFLFGLTAELSIVSYFVLWRWFLRDWAWGAEGPLSDFWSYWSVMSALTVPWTFGIPLLGPLLLKRRYGDRYSRELLI